MIPKYLQPNTHIVQKINSLMQKGNIGDIIEMIFFHNFVVKIINNTVK